MVRSQPLAAGRSPRRAFLAFLAAFALFTALVQVLAVSRGASPRLVVGDAESYYAWARSVVVDRDLDFENDLRLLAPPGLPEEAFAASPRNARGRMVNKTSVGLGILELPATLAAHAVASFSGRWPADGVSLPYQAAVSASLLLLFVGGYLSLFDACVHLGADEKWAFWTLLGCLAATNAVHYVTKEPAMTHASGVALFGILALLVSRSPREGAAPPAAALAAAGALFGLLFLVRNTNVLFAPSVAWMLWTRSSLGIRRAWPFGLAAAAVATLQLAANSAQWGELRIASYAGEGFTAGLAGIGNALFGARHGLFVYHPWYLVLVGICALGLGRRESRAAAAAALSSFALLAVANGTWWAWWFGDSFGNRAFIEGLGPLSLGAAISLSALPFARARPRVVTAWAATLIALLGTLNALLWLGYLLHRYPADGSHTVREAYGWMSR